MEPTPLLCYQIVAYVASVYVRINMIQWSRFIVWQYKYPMLPDNLVRKHFPHDIFMKPLKETSA